MNLSIFVLKESNSFLREGFLILGCLMPASSNNGWNVYSANKLLIFRSNARSVSSARGTHEGFNLGISHFFVEQALLQYFEYKEMVPIL